MKAHLLDSDFPLIEGRDHEAICGETVKHAVFVYVFDSGTVPEFLSSMSAINTCQTCYRANLSKRWIYGLVPGEEYLRRHPEAESVAA